MPCNSALNWMKNPGKNIAKFDRMALDISLDSQTIISTLDNSRNYHKVICRIPKQSCNGDLGFWYSITGLTRTHHCIGENEARCVYPCTDTNATMKANVRVKKVIENNWMDGCAWISIIRRNKSMIRKTDLWLFQLQQCPRQEHDDVWNGEKLPPKLNGWISHEMVI